MRSYWRSVWACMPASWAATEMTKTGASSGTSPRRASAITALRGGQAAERGRDRRPRIVSLRGGVLLQSLARLGGHLLRHVDVDGDEQVAGRPAASAGHALASDAKPRTVTDAGGYPDVDRAGLRRDARAEAVGAGVVDDLARAAAVAARLAEPERTLVAAD